MNCFRYNCCFRLHVSFEALLGLAAHHAPASYWDIVQREILEGRSNGQADASPPQDSHRNATGRYACQHWSTKINPSNQRIPYI